jgi:hydroxyacid-oxoacid transhydrogenase
MACSNIRYGPGVTSEVGMDLANLGAKNVAVFTDKNIAAMPPMRATIESLHKSGINFKVFDQVRVEPNDQR